MTLEIETGLPAVSPSPLEFFRELLLTYSVVFGDLG